MSVDFQEKKVQPNKTAPIPGGDALEDASFEIPLSFAQERLWFLDQLHPENALYNVPTAIRIHGDLNCKALKRSLETIIQRHEVLRTTYRLFNEAPVQEVHDSFELNLPLVDMTASGAAEREREVQLQMKEYAAHPFDLKKDLMLRAALFRMAANEHIFFLNIHHIACDEWSMGVFFKELAQVYSSIVCGRPHALSEPPVQYADFSIWQRESMAAGLLQKQLAYWKGQLSGDLPVLELPTDYPRPAERTFQGAKVKRAFTKEFSEVIATRCRKENVTPFIFFLASLKALLYRYTGQEDLVIGTPIAGRNRMETEDLIGFFVNTLALRSKVSAEAGFREHLARVREITLSAFANQDIPFEKVVEEVQPDRSAAQNPIFNVMFAVQNRGGKIDIPGLQVSVEEVETDTAKFDMTLVVQDSAEGFVVLLEFNTALFSPHTASRFLLHFESLVGAILANPGEPIASLQLIAPTEREKLLVEWNQTATAFPKDTSVHELFARQAQNRPTDIAIVYGKEQATYREIDERSNQLANHLKKLGVLPGVLVGICVERSIEMVVGWLGILKAGGAYVPLDPGYPAERLQFMLEDSQMPVLITQKKLVSLLPEKARKLCVDSDWNQIAQESSASPGVPVSPEDIAYVIYTSGSTGKPKGAAVPHLAIARLVFNTNYIQLGPNDTVAQASNSSFDAATFEVWGALLLGGKLIGVPQNVLLSPGDLAKHLRDHRITTLFLTTALFNQVAAEIPNAFSTLKHVLFGGEACDPKSVKEVLRHGPPQRLLHVYGPTETTTFASWYEIQDVPEGATTIPIGRPLSNTTFFVLDKNRQPVPVGIPGELYIGGDCLARGYHNREELTATKFVPHPFKAGERLYRTGDLVRYLRDGNVEFLGRIDNQVKIRGFRIELEEIEIALKQQGAIRDAIVVVREGASGKRLVAYVVAQHSPPTAEDLRVYLRQKVPDFMVPTAFVFLGALPLTPNGKIDRRALPEPVTGPAKAKESDFPRNNLENQLAKIWESILNIKPIGIHDNFFELGGHSLLAVRLFTQIEKTMGQKLPLSTLFQAPTIEGLANVMRQKTWSSPGASLVEIQPRGSRPPMFWLHTLGGGGGGGLFVYRKLAELLGPDQPSYGLVTPPEPFTSMELMAAHYISEIKTLQPIGPYFIGGYCFGGIIAFEIARQLATSGNKVGLLALIDSTPPNCAQKDKYSLAMVLHFIRTLPEWVSAQTKDGIRPMALRSGRRIGAGLKKLAKYFQHPIPNTAGGASPMNKVHDKINEIIDFTHYPEHYKRYAEVHWTALDAYKPQVFDGSISLYRTARPHLLEFDAEKYWAQLSTKGVEVQIVPGTHEKVLESPNVELLAREIRKSMGIVPAAHSILENTNKMAVSHAA